MNSAFHCKFQPPGSARNGLFGPWDAMDRVASMSKHRRVAGRRTPKGVHLAGRARKPERRRWERLPLALPIFLRGVNERGEEFLEFTTALNVSAGGALLATRRYLRPSLRITLEIPSAPLPKLMLAVRTVRTMQARVIRVINSEQCYLSGLRFVRPLL